MASTSERAGPDLAGDEEVDFFPDEINRATETEVQEMNAAAQISEDGEESDGGELPVYDDPTGSMFSCPNDPSTMIPSSVSNYAHRNRSSRELTRLSGEYDAATKRRRRSSVTSRKSISSRKSSSRPKLKTQTSTLSNPVLSDESDDDVAVPRKSGVFSGITAMLRSSSYGASKNKTKTDDEESLAPSRRSSMHSVRSNTAGRLRGRTMSTTSVGAVSAHSGSDSDLEDGDAYGPYGSAASTSSTVTTDSQDSQIDPRDRAQSIPGGLFITHGFVGGGDPFFGDHRVDIHSPTQSDIDEGRLENAEAKVFESLGGSTTGARQPLYIPDEDLQLVFIGWGQKTWKAILWYIGCFLTLGILPLLGRWFPNLWLRGKGKVREFSRATSIVAHVCVPFRYKTIQLTYVPCRLSMAINMSCPFRLSSLTTLCPNPLSSHLNLEHLLGLVKAQYPLQS